MRTVTSTSSGTHPPMAIHADGRVLPTLEADGSRRWLFPRLAGGQLWHARRWVAYVLIAVFSEVPFIRISGRPAVLIDVANRELTLFGQTFLPRDTVLLALLMVSWILSIFLFTAVLGRAWCGWACPQTVYMEFLYRPIERLFLGRKGAGGRPARGLSSWRYVGMYVAFLVASCCLAHTFLAYFVGLDQLRVWVTRNPLEHPWSFAIIAGATAAVMFNFSYFREQTCLIACPYGRLQSVLLDRESLVVRYDRTRGEPRGKASASVALPVLSEAPARSGDCVACTMCVQVCPTGIDIRDGLQFECVNCTQCIDACNAVMEKVGKPKGLIRYASLSSLEGRPTRALRPRVFAYAGAMVALLSLLTYLLASRKPVDVLLVRNPGLPFVLAPDGRVENTMRVQMTNRLDVPAKFRVSVVGDGAVELAEAGEDVALNPRESAQKPAHLLALPSAFRDGRRAVTIRVTAPDGSAVEQSLQMFGPGDGVSPAVPATRGQP